MLVLQQIEFMRTEMSSDISALTKMEQLVPKFTMSSKRAVFVGSTSGREAPRQRLSSKTSGSVRGNASQTYEANYPRPGWAEQYPKLWEAALYPRVRGVLPDRLTCVERAMLERGRRILLLVDMSKFNLHQFALIGPLGKLSDVISDETPNSSRPTHLKTRELNSTTPHR